MKRLGLYWALFLILVMGLMPLYTLTESLTRGEISPPVQRDHWNTNNTTRIWAQDWREIQQQALNILYPSLRKSPEYIVVTDASSWTQNVVASSLLAAPSRGALVMHEAGGEETLRIIARLNPPGSEALDKTQIILVGNTANLAADLQNKGYRVLNIKGDDADIAYQVCQIRQKIQPTDRVLAISAEAGYSFALPAVSWAAHRGTPIVLVHEQGVPPSTRAALSQIADPLVYLVGPPQRSQQAARQLESLAQVRRVGDQDPVNHAIAFARYFDPDSRLGWRATPASTEGSKMFLLAPPQDWQTALAGVQLFSRSIFGPLLLLSSSQRVDPALEKFYFSVKPDWWVTPAEGPYNHTWLLGDPAKISYAVQGRVNFLQEIDNYETQGNQGMSGIELLSLLWFILAVAGAVWIWFHLSTRMFELSPFMTLAWVLLVLAVGPLGLWAYYTCYRGYAHQVARGEFRRPVWVQVLAATCSTAGFGIPTMIAIAFVLTFLGLPLIFTREALFGLGAPMIQSILWSYLGTLLIQALVFVPLMLSMKESSTYWGTVKDNWLTVFISMTAISAGMMTSMWLIMMGYLDQMPEESNLNWWGSMYAASIVGLFTGYLGNWPLVMRGEKKGSM